ncbi:MAG: hypothetical protein L3J28_00030 [Candidatus Polarisedimenticolaceae bacterium]|nr:hypothetical protein [Candidatus Polarisedimenticolaceae bacterium]
MSFNIAALPILILAVVGAGSMFWVMKVLSNEVSHEKLNNVEELSKLWKTSFPPSSVLTERGLKIQFRYRLFIILLIIGTGVMGYFLTGFSLSPIAYCAE